MRVRPARPVWSRPAIETVACCADSAAENPELCYEAIRLLELLAQEPSLHRALVREGSLPPLTNAAAGPSPQARSFAARALVHLATTGNEKAAVIHRHLVDAGSYAAIARQVADSHPDVAVHAAKSVGDVLRHGGAAAEKLLELGAVAGLRQLIAPASDGAVHSGTAAAVGALSALGKQLADTLGKEGCQQLCVAATELLSEPSPASKLSATAALAELAQVQSLEDIVTENRESRALCLCELLGSEDGRVRASAARCIGNLALHQEYAQVFGRRETAGPLLHALAPHEDLATRQEASRAISNLAASRTNDQSESPHGPPSAHACACLRSSMPIDAHARRRPQGVRGDLAARW